MSDYLENTILNLFLRANPSSFTPPANIYVALFTSPTTDSSTGTEVTGGSYARQLVTFAAPVNGVINNNVAVTFPSASDDWGTVTHMALVTASTGGNMLWHGPLETPRVINSGDYYVMPANEIEVSLQ